MLLVCAQHMGSSAISVENQIILPRCTAAVNFACLHQAKHFNRLQNYLLQFTQTIWINCDEPTINSLSTIYIDTLNVSKRGDWWVDIQVNNKQLTCKIDSGAEANVLSLHDLCSMYPQSNVN